MKPYFFIITQTHFRTGAHIGKITGIVFAANEDEAQEKAWELADNNNACGLSVQEIDPEKGYKFTVYKSEI